MSGSILGNIIGFAYGAEQERIAKEELEKLPEYQQLQNISELSSLYDNILRLTRRPYSAASDSAFRSTIAQGTSNAYANTMRQDAGLANSVLGAAQLSGMQQMAQREVQGDAMRGNYFSMLSNIVQNMQGRSDTNINQGNARLMMQEQALGQAVQQGKQKQYESAVQFGDATESKVGTIMGMVFGGGAGGQVKYDSQTVDAPQQQQTQQGVSNIQYGGYGYGPSLSYGGYSQDQGWMGDQAGMGYF